MGLDNIYFKRNDNKKCSIWDVLTVLGNCSKLEISALSNEAKFEGQIKEGLVELSYYPEFFGISKEEFLEDILSAGYKVVIKD